MGQTAGRPCAATATHVGPFPQARERAFGDLRGSRSKHRGRAKENPLSSAAAGFGAANYDRLWPEADDLGIATRRQLSVVHQAASSWGLRAIFSKRASQKGVFPEPWGGLRPDPIRQKRTNNTDFGALTEPLTNRPAGAAAPPASRS
jgi:hypothetical protein